MERSEGRMQGRWRDEKKGKKGDGKRKKDGTMGERGARGVR